MPQPLTLFTGQWADLPLDAGPEKASGRGFDGCVISNHLARRAVRDDPIDERHREILPGRIWGDGDPELPDSLNA